MAEHRRRLSRLIDRRGIPQVKRMYDDAQARLLKRVAQVGAPHDSFTAQQHRVLLVELRQGQQVIAKRAAGELADISRDAQVEALRGFNQDLFTLEKHFTGADIPLPTDEASRFRGIIDGRTSLLQEHIAKSMASWTTEQIAYFENELSMAMMTGESVAQVIDRVAEAQDAEWWRAERVVRTECLPGDTLVTGAVIRAVGRRWYEGPMVDIITEGGRKFSTTPNHPMLTNRVWVAAEKIMPGDNLICYDGKQDAGAPGNEHVTAKPATLAQIFDTLSTIGVCERRRTTEPDFHGDGRKGHVDIFSPSGELPLGLFSPLYEPLAKNIFTPTDFLGARFCGRCQRLLSVQQQRCLCSVPDTYSRFFKALADKSFAYIQRFSDITCSFPRFVTSYNIFDWHPSFISRVWSSPLIEAVPGFRQRANYSSICNYTPDPAHANLHLFSNEVGAEPRDIKLDCVLSVTIRQFSGHVYHLSTSHGYYTINGAYTGNTSWAFNLTNADAYREAADELPDLEMRWCEYVDDTSLEAKDNRVAIDSIIMHGQIVKPGHVFQFPPESAWPDEVDWEDKEIEKQVKRIPRHVLHGSWGAPPNRPNDRSTIAPWRSHWGVWGWRLDNGQRVPVE